MAEQKKRYNFGLVVGNIEDDFSNQVCKGAMRAAELVGDNLFIFPVKYLGQTEQTKNDQKQKYEYQYNYLISYAHSKSLDMVLLCLSTIGYRVSAEQCREILHSFDGIPVLLIASKEEGYSSITYDNVTGLSMGIRYLIEERSCSHIAMLTGAEYNDDARERLQTYKDVLTAKGFPVEERRIAHGDFSEKCVKEVEELLLNNPDMDAIVCANDAMAKTAYQILNKYGFAIGRDICVIGFDDISDAAYMEPPLATVRADASVLGYRAVVECHRMLKEQEGTTALTADEADGGKPAAGRSALQEKHFTVDTAFIKRESASGVKARKKVISEEMESEYINKLTMMVDMNHRMNIVNRDMLMFGNSSDKNYARFLDAFAIDEVSSCYLYMMNKPTVYEQGKKWRLPESMYLKAYKIGYEVVELPRSLQRVPMNELFSNPCYSEERKNYIIVDIYSRELQYGILVCDMPYRYFHYVEMLCYQISIAMKIMELFSVQEKLLEDKEDMLKKLERENLLLDDISNKDELTGILNRRGFITKVEKLLRQPENSGKKAVMVYADLNYLKLINDRYSHGEGNYAIQSCAETLETSLGQSGIAGRIGGDEFAGFAWAEEAGDGSSIQQAVKQVLSKKNAVSGKPYEVMASVGTFEFIIGPDVNLKTLMQRADERLYEDKSRKGPFIERKI